nr:CDP-alcohol phosphatidyltransferase family protein [Parvularcula maris]
MANRLTITRMALVLPYALLALNGERLVAGVVFAVAAVTDLLDGHFARVRSEETMLGKVLDPIADKMLTITALIVLVAMDTLHGIHLLAAVIIAMREFWVAGLREGLIDSGAELPVSAMAKVKTTLQLVALFLLTLGDSFIGYTVFWAAALLTLYTGYQYTVDSFKVLNLGADETTSS